MHIYGATCHVPQKEILLPSFITIIYSLQVLSLYNVIMSCACCKFTVPCDCAANSRICRSRQAGLIDYDIVVCVSACTR